MCGSVCHLFLMNILYPCVFLSWLNLNEGKLKKIILSFFPRVCFADICLLLKLSVMLLPLFLRSRVDVMYHPRMLCSVLCYDIEDRVLLIYFLSLIYRKLDTQHLMNMNTVKTNIILSCFCGLPSQLVYTAYKIWPWAKMWLKGCIFLAIGNTWSTVTYAFEFLAYVIALKEEWKSK
jgi:hypothetical protein